MYRHTHFQENLTRVSRKNLVQALCSAFKLLTLEKWLYLELGTASRDETCTAVWFSLSSSVTWQIQPFNFTLCTQSRLHSIYTKRLFSGSMCPTEEKPTFCTLWWQYYFPFHLHSRVLVVRMNHVQSLWHAHHRLFFSLVRFSCNSGWNLDRLVHMG